MDRPLSDEEKRILETAAHCLPGGALGSTRLPDDLTFIDHPKYLPQLRATEGRG